MKRLDIIKNILNVILLFLIGVASIVFTVLYVNTFNCGFLANNKRLLTILITACVCVLVIVSIICTLKNNKFIYKLTVITLGLFTVLITTLYILKITGVLDKIDSVESLRNYVAYFGYLAVIIYVLINVLQVVLLPIPGVVLAGTGLALFGALKTAIFSFIGVFLGSIIAFFIGRRLGYKVVSWLVGKEQLDKGIKSIRRKDKVILTFMFLFPLFPDDLLCFVAGLSSMSTLYFITMIFCCRLISAFATAFSLNGSIIPYNTWWGILIWVVFFALICLLATYVYKNGEVLEKKFKRLFKKQKQK